MSYFSYQQEKALAKVLNDVLSQKVNNKTIKTIKDNNLLEALNKNAYEEQIKEDVLFSAENNGLTINEKQLEQIAHIVESKYDHSQYDEFIVETIMNEQNKQLP